MNKVEKAYITKRLVASRSRKAFSNASKKAMIDHGYIIVAVGDKIVKQYSDGRKEELSSIPTTNNQDLLLD